MRQLKHSKCTTTEHSERFCSVICLIENNYVQRVLDPRTALAGTVGERMFGLSVKPGKTRFW